MSNRADKFSFSPKKEAPKKLYIKLFWGHYNLPVYSLSHYCRFYSHKTNLDSILPVAFICRDELIQLMVGRKLETNYPLRDCRKNEAVLKVEGLTGNGVSNISFSLYKGEILGIAGLVGSGRTEIMRVLYGAEPAEGGEIVLNGKKSGIDRTGKIAYY